MAGVAQPDLDIEIMGMGRMTAVIGPPGSGKTATAAAEVARAQARGITTAWGSAWPAPDGPAGWHWQSFAHELGVEWDSAAPLEVRASRVLRAIRSADQMLIALDDIDEADDDSLTILDAIGRQLPVLDAQIVITSRDTSPLRRLRTPWQAIELRAPRRPIDACAARLERRRDHWIVQQDDSVLMVPDRKGMAHLAVLFSRPDHDVHVLELAGSTGSVVLAAGTEVADDRALAAYRRRHCELAEDLAEAEANSDMERAAQHRAALDALTDAVASMVGLGGRSRRMCDAAERARLNVTRSIRSAIARIGAADATLGRHLEVSVRTGTYCSYRPDPAAALRWEVAG
jgi:RecA/RadA recombinase